MEDNRRTKSYKSIEQSSQKSQNMAKYWKDEEAGKLRSLRTAGTVNSTNTMTSRMEASEN